MAHSDVSPSLQAGASISFSGLRLPWPTEWTSLFDRKATTVMEIGFGGGHFLVDLAARSPDVNVLGVERSFYSLTETEHRIFKAEVNNVRLIYADARLTLAYVCQPESLDAIYVNFPDPFPKKGHAKRRLIAPETLALIASRLRPDGLLTIATDVSTYAHSIADSLAHTEGLHNRHSTAWVDDLPNRIRTRYERKAREKGAPCYYFEWERIAATLPPVISPPTREEEMPNAVLSIPLPLERIAAAFEPGHHVQGNFHIHFLTLYLSQDNHSLLIDTLVAEPLIEQRVGVLVTVAFDEPERYVVRLDALGFPRPTPGTHAAVGLVVDWLTGLSPDVRVLHRAIDSPP